MRDPLTFALVSDLHFGPEARYEGKLRKLTGHAARLTRAFAATMRETVKPRFVVNLGDDIEDEAHDVDLERYSLCQSILQESGCEIINVAGNHDTARLSEREVAHVWGLPADASLHYAVERGGVRFIVLHTRERKDLDISLGEAQLEWVREELARSSLPAIVLMHHPASDQDLRGNRWFEGKPHIAFVRERRTLRKTLRESGRVLAVFNGHLHWNHLDLHDGIPYVTVQSLIENLDEDAPGRPAAAHAVVRVDDKRIVVEVRGAETCRYQFARSPTA